MKKPAMKSTSLVTVMISLCFSVTSDAGLQKTDQKKSTAKIQNPKLQKELRKRFKVDQEARKAAIGWMRKNSALQNKQKPQKNPFVANMMKVDTENREWLKKIVAKHGWPGKSMVGETGAHDAWLLVQHADSDREFQQKCLDLMTAAPKGEVSGKDIAYLTDRVRAGTGRKQIYGTQVAMKNGKFEVKNLEDPKNVNKRRKEVGLGTIEDYLKLIEKTYGSSKPKKKSKK